MTCEDAPCCGCCNPPTLQDQREAEEAYWEIRDLQGNDPVDTDDCEDTNCATCEYAADCTDYVVEPADEGDDPFHGDDVAADADVLASAGMGTDEDYGCYDTHDIDFEDRMCGE